MKIACLISSLCLGGAERQMLALASTLGEAGHDVEVVTYHKAVFYSDICREKGIRHTLIEKTGSSAAFAKELARHLQNTGTELVIAFCTGASLKACLAHIHYPGFRLFVSERISSRHYLPHDALRFHLYRRHAERVICNNFTQAEFIAAHFPSLNAKVAVIPNFVDTKLFNPLPHAPNVPRVIMVSGRVCRRKNLHGLVEAARILRSRGCSFTVRWYGAQNEDRYLKKCRAKIDRYGLGDCVEILPATQDIASAYRSADIFCLPSFYEGTSNSLAEALACGLPVVCSAVGDNLRYVMEGLNGHLFNPYIASSIADALELALTSSTEQLGAQGGQSRKTAVSKLGQREFSDNYAGLL